MILDGILMQGLSTPSMKVAWEMKIGDDLILNEGYQGLQDNYLNHHPS